MTTSRLTTVATIICVIVGFLLLDDLIAAGMGNLGDLSVGQLGWRVAPLLVGGAALVVIAIRLRRAK